MTSEGLREEAGVIKMSTCTSLHSLNFSRPCGIPRKPWFHPSFHLPSSAQHPTPVPGSRVLCKAADIEVPRCGSGLKVSKFPGKTEVGPEDGRTSGLNMVIGTICLEVTGPQHIYFVFPLCLVSFQRQQLFTQISGLAQL